MIKPSNNLINQLKFHAPGRACEGALNTSGYGVLYPSNRQMRRFKKKKEKREQQLLNIK